MPQEVLRDSSGLANGELEEPLIVSPYPVVGQAVPMVTNSRPGGQVMTGGKSGVGAREGGHTDRKEVADTWR